MTQRKLTATRASSRADPAAQQGPQHVVVVDDSMAPTLREGDIVTFDRGLDALNGDIVLVEDQGGTQRIRRYVTTSPNTFAAIADNAALGTATTAEPGLRVLAVATQRTRALSPRFLSEAGSKPKLPFPSLQSAA